MVLIPEVVINVIGAAIVIAALYRWLRIQPSRPKPWFRLRDWLNARADDADDYDDWEASNPRRF
uniref:hypothetical protein n=1 Tax=Burkholderia arboris TaxID=488730 RepID=UPI003BEF0E64